MDAVEAAIVGYHSHHRNASAHVAVLRVRPAPQHLLCSQRSYFAVEQPDAVTDLFSQRGILLEGTGEAGEDSNVLLMALLRS